MKKRFTDHRELYKDFFCLDPRLSSEFKDCGLPPGALDNLCELLAGRVQKDALKIQLEIFASVYPRLAMSLAEEYIQFNTKEEDFDGEKNNEDI